MLLPLMALAVSGCGRKSIDEQFAEGARQETQQMCPRKMDDCTTLDSIVYDIPTRTQIHYYTFSGQMDDKSIFTENFTADIRETMLKSLRNEIKLKKQMDAGISFAYIYRSEKQKGRTIFELTFTKEDYTGPMVMRTFEERTTGKWQDYTMRFCPEEQDECTVLDSVVYRGDERVLEYRFSLKGELDVEDFDSIYPEAKKEMKKVLIRGIRENASLKEENDSSISYCIRYFSQSRGRKLMEIKIKGEEIGN